MDKTGQEVLAFLAGNILDATPMNYRFGYLYVTSSSKVVKRETDALVENGMRVRQEDIAEIMAQHADMSEDPAELAAARDEALDMFMDAATELAQETKRQAGEAGRDIAQDGELISKGAEGEDLTAAIARIVDRASEAERELATASNMIDRLQRDLEEARSKALVDELTGIANRRATKEILKNLELAKTRYSVALVDIDHFKNINDTYGHFVGDRAIKLVADQLVESLAPATVARWGGEEFLVVSEMSDHKKLAGKIDEAKQTLAGRNLKLRETDEPIKKITFSAGVVPNGESSEGTIGQADILLYEAKKAGRDRVIAS